MPAEQGRQPGEGGLAGAVCWLTRTNQGCFVLAGMAPPGWPWSGEQLPQAGERSGGRCGQPSAGTGLSVVISPAACVWVRWNSQCYCRVMALDPKAATAAPAAHAEDSFRSREGETGSLANRVPSFIFLCFLGCLSLRKVPNITNFKCCYMSSFPICKEAPLPRLSEVLPMSVPGVFCATLQSCEYFQKLCQGLSTQLFSLTEGSS